MGQAAHFVDRLKRRLKAQGVTYKDLARRLGIAESTLKRSFSDGNFTLARLEAICDALAIEFADLAGKPSPGASRNYLTSEQEQALAADVKLFALFYLLGDGLPLAKIVRNFTVSIRDARALTARLEALGLVVRGPDDKIRMLIKPNIWWRDGGPLDQRYNASIRTDFFDSAFAGVLQDRWFLTGRISPSSLRLVSRKMTNLITEMREMFEVDQGIDRSETANVTFFGGYRPWVMPVLRALRRQA